MTIFLQYQILLSEALILEKRRGLSPQIFLDVISEISFYQKVNHTSNVRIDNSGNILGDRPLCILPNLETYPEFGQALEVEKKAGVEVLYLDCNVTEDGLEIV